MQLSMHQKNSQPDSVPQKRKVVQNRTESSVTRSK